MPPPPIEAVILAAGASTRLGRPKALLEFDGLTALEVLMASLREAGLVQGVIVTGDAEKTMRAAVDPTPFAWVRNPMPAAGR